jgi:hypothetical protein
MNKFKISLNIDEETEILQSLTLLDQKCEIMLISCKLKNYVYSELVNSFLKLKLKIKLLCIEIMEIYQSNIKTFENLCENLWSNLNNKKIKTEFKGLSFLLSLTKLRILKEENKSQNKNKFHVPAYFVSLNKIGLLNIDFNNSKKENTKVFWKDLLSFLNKSNLN